MLTNGTGEQHPPNARPSASSEPGESLAVLKRGRTHGAGRDVRSMDANRERTLKKDLPYELDMFDAASE
jgi:hypothetical protein